MPRPGGLIDAFVVDPRCPHRDRTRRRGDLTGGVGAVANHQLVTRLVDLPAVRIDVRGDLGLQRRGQHLPGTITDQLIEQRATHRRRPVNLRFGHFLGYREHRRTFPNQRANAGS